MNDAYLPYNTTPEMCRLNLCYMLDRVKAALPHCECVLQCMNVCIDQHSEARPNLAAYYQVYRAVAAEHRLTLVDHEPLWAVSIGVAHGGNQRNTPKSFGNHLATRVRSSGSANAGWTRPVPLVLPGWHPSGATRVRDDHHSEHHRFLRATRRRRAS